VSGGSYEYLYAQDWRDGTHNCEPSLQQMAERLAGLGYADDAAAETLDTLLYLRQVRVFTETRWERMRAVWKAVEWWDSGDSGEDGLKEALEAYRAGTP
jgi:hypothetical protein